MKPRIVLATALLVVASGALALGVAEVALRVSGLASPAVAQGLTASEFERLPGYLRPGAEAIDRSIQALPHRVTIDSLGFRGADFPRAKAPGEYRVLFTGDSFVYGAFVDDSVTIPVLLEHALQRECAGARVINAGLAGSTISDQRHIVQRGFQLEPDAVILMFYDNDLDDLVGPGMWEGMAANRERKSRFPWSLAYQTVGRTALWQVLLRGARRAEQAPETAQAGGRPDQAPAPELFARYRTELLALRDTLVGRGIPLMLAAMASHRTVSGEAADLQVPWVLSLADSLGIPAVNVEAAMKASGLPMTSLFLLPHDGHASPTGNRIMAAAIAEGLGPTMPCASQH